MLGKKQRQLCHATKAELTFMIFSGQDSSIGAMCPRSWIVIKRPLKIKKKKPNTFLYKYK